MVQISCKNCGSSLVQKPTKKTTTQLQKPYYYTAYYWCEHCQKLYHDEKFKVTNERVPEVSKVLDTLGTRDTLSNVIEIWTDGACVYNGTPRAKAAWAFVSGKTERCGLIEGKQTNNVAEAMAIYEALSWAASNGYTKIKLYTDSQISLFNLKKRPDQIKVNAEIFAKIFECIRSSHLEVEFIKVLGHADDVNNNRADRLANGLVTKITR